MKSSDEARSKALALAAKNLPPLDWGTAIKAEDVVFGTWDETHHKFTPNRNSRSAVRVTADQTEVTGNPVPVFLLQFAGLNNWNVVTDATYVTYHPTCLKEGFVAEDVVDIQSNNSFSNGFCIHSNTYVSLNSNNYFEPGTVVSMPDLDDLELPNSGYKTNTGLREALREGSWNIRIVERIGAIIEGLRTYDARYLPSYITTTVPGNLSATTLTSDMMAPGKVYFYSCSGNKSLTIAKDVALKKLVLVTNCAIKFSQGVSMEDAIIATTNTRSRSINAPSGLRLGKNDSCATGGGAQILTMGSVSVASGLEMYGNLRRGGSAACDLAYPASGRLDGYWEAQLQPWDVAAGALLVREAGGVVTRMHGAAWDLGHGDVAAGNGALVGLMSAELRAARGERGA